MGDLLKRLRDMQSKWTPTIREAADLIEQLEREVAIAEKMATDANEAYSQAHVSMIEALDQLAAEEALADRFAQGVLNFDAGFGLGTSKSALAAYRKARGL